MSELDRKPQKALHLYLDEDKKKPAHIGHIYYIFEKYDGWYMYIDCIDGKWQEIRSRACRELDSMRHYTKMFKEQVPAPKVDCRLIFEACLHEKGLPMVFSKLNGLFNQKKIALKRGAIVQSKTLGKVELEHEVYFKCHDVVIFNEENKSFRNRYSDLQTLFRKIDTVNSKLLSVLHIAPVLGCTPHKNLWYAQYEDVCKKYNNNGEGIILKRADAPYTYKAKNADVLKIKCENSFELRVTGVREGEGKYKGTLGKLVVTDAAGNHNEVSGMTDAQRDLWWTNPELIVGQIVEVMCMKVLANKSLREGRFKSVRHDKDYPDEL